MICPQVFFDALTKNGVDFFTGVPDSLLKDFCAYVTSNSKQGKHIIAANEGNAVAIATGHYLGTGSPSLVYLQNSGLGNTINPLLSINDKEVYGIPVLLLIGWRGEPNVKDEPQHIKQGRVTPALLDLMGIPWEVLDSDTKDVSSVVSKSVAKMLQNQGPVAFLVRKNTFTRYSLNAEEIWDFKMSREDAIQELVNLFDRSNLTVATTGMVSRELYEYRSKRGDSLGSDFLTVGGMGHAASISLGLSKTVPNRTVICLDGDGAALMHMGGMGIIGQSKQKNLIHVVLNNGAHDSVGGQPTCAFGISLTSIAKACGYKNISSADSPVKIRDEYRILRSKDGPSFLEIRVNKGSRHDLGRPKSTPLENRDALMHNIRHEK